MHSARILQPSGQTMTAILVTGATGFIGQPTCKALLSGGHAVAGATRSVPVQMHAQPVVVGDIGPDADWSKALAGREVVVHLAAHVHAMGGKASDFHRVNVEGSENLARQAARAGVQRFVFMSSVKVSGEVTRERAFTESDPPQPADAYGASKAEAEIRLKALCANSGMELVILRPPLVYGSGVKANFLNLIRAVDAGVPFPLSSIVNLRSLVYVGNLVDALGVCLRPEAANRTFFVSDGYDLSTPRLIKEIAVALGKRPLLFPFPPALLHVAGLLTGRSEQLARLTGSLQVDISSIKATLGWNPPFSLQQGLAATASWYRTRSS